MFPFMTQGHITPFLALALHLDHKGYQITFINTPLNIKNLQTTLSLSLSSTNINLLPIPFNSSDHGLPPDSENTDSLPYNLILRLLEVSSSLKPEFRKILCDLINNSPPLCVISDFFFGWSAEVSHEFGIFHVMFSGAGGFGLACYYSAWLNLPHLKTNSMEFTLPDFQEAGRLQVTQLTRSLLAADGSDPWSVFQRRNLPSWVNSDGLLFNTVEELDNIGLHYFRRKLGKPIWPIGPILLSVNYRTRSGGRNDTTTISPESCKQWLKKNPPNSVLYISFGSQNTISATQMIQLAKAVDESGKNFIWVVRPPLGFDITAEFKAEEWLPENFSNRTKTRGLIIEKWAPQAEILAHESVGAFMSHCGWNSVLESLTHGVPMIGWPMAAEQFYNVKFLEEVLGVCVEVARGTSFQVRSEDIMQKIELVMSEKGEEMRRKACDVEKMIGDGCRDEDGFKGSSVKALEEFLDAAFLMREKANREVKE